MILERYILRNYIGPFIFSMSVITFVFIMDFILRYINLFLEKGVAFHIVLQVFTLSLGHMFALIIPMAVLPATLMTFGTLASENEITAMKASGVSMYRMIRPGVFAGVLLTLALVWYNNHVLPESNHRLMNLVMDIGRKQPTVELRENRFIDDLKGYTIHFRGKNDRTGEISDVQIFKQGEKGMLPTTIVADSGRLKYLEDRGILRVELHDGEIHELPVARDAGKYRRTRFRSYTLHIRDVDRTLQRSERTYRGDREMSVAMMSAKIAEIRADMALAHIRMGEVGATRMHNTFRLLDRSYRHQRYGAPDSTARVAMARPAPLRAAAGAGLVERRAVEARGEFATRQEVETQVNKIASYDRQIDRYRVEIHKKYSIPFACLIFVLVGSPLAIRMGRSGMNMAIGLSILFFLVYYVCLIGGEKVADRGLVSPIVAMWSPNLIFGVLAVILLRKAAHEQSVKEWTFLSWIRSQLRRHATTHP